MHVPMDTLKKSLKSYGSGKHTRRFSTGGENKNYEVIVKIDDGDASDDIWETSTKKVEPSNKKRLSRQSSVRDFWTAEENVAGGKACQLQKRTKTTAEEAATSEGTPPSRLIGQFLQKQKVSGSYFSLDMDLEMEELKKEQNLPLLTASQSRLPSDVPNTPGALFRRRRKDSMGGSSRLSKSGSDVVRCTSNASFQRELETPEPELSFQKRSDMERRKEKSRLKSGMLAKPKTKPGHDDDNDPFKDEDVPSEYKMTNFSVCTLLQWLSLVLNIGALACTFSIRVLREKHLWMLRLWKWEVLILVTICGRLVSGLMIKIMVFFVERNFILRKRVVYFVYGIRSAVQNSIWLGLVLLAWHFLLVRRVNSIILNYVTKVLLCLLIASVLWLVKTLIVKVLASSFHVRSYFDRIQDALYNQYVIQTLSGPPWVETQNEEEEQRAADEVRKLKNAGSKVPSAVINGSGSSKSRGLISASGGITERSTKHSKTFSTKSEAAITIAHLHRLNPKNVSAWNMKRLMNIVRKRHLTTLDEEILDSTEDGNKIKSEFEATAAAKKIFGNVARPGSDYIYLEDLMRFMEEDDPIKTMNLFDGAIESKRISKTSLKNWVVNSYRDRIALSLTLNDTKTAVNRLRCVVDVIVAIIIIIIWLRVLDIITSANIVYATSQLVVVAFVFGNTCKAIFEALVFLFIMHPLDVGDRCEIDGVQMVVEEMNILTTIFLRYDNTKTVYPNSTLATKPINNFYRSPDTGDAVDFCVHISTPLDKITLMKQRIISYIENKKEHWYPAPMIVLKDIDELNRMKFAVWLQHKMNSQDMGERWARRALLLEEMVRIFQELDIQYRLLPIDVNVRAMPPTSGGPLPSYFTATTS